MFNSSAVFHAHLSCNNYRTGFALLFELGVQFGEQCACAEYHSCTPSIRAIQCACMAVMYMEGIIKGVAEIGEALKKENIH